MNSFLVVLLSIPLVLSYSRYSCSPSGYEKYLLEYTSKKGPVLDENREYIHDIIYHVVNSTKIIWLLAN